MSRIPVRVTDAVVPALIGVLATLELLAVRPAGWPGALAVELLAAGLLVLRRPVPLAAATAAGVVVLGIPWFGPALDVVATPILVLAVSIYSLARWVPDLRGLGGVAVLLLVTGLDYFLVDDRVHDVTDIVFVASLTVPPYVFGRVVRRTTDQKRQLEEAQRAMRDRAVRDERDRIARDLHDVVAHSLSAMVVQTAAAQDLVHADPDQAAALLGRATDIGRRALAETGRLLHVIRDEEDELGLDPAPGLAQLPGLLEEFRGHGLRVDATLPDSPPALPGSVDVSAYRIAREVLTNALRHAPDRHATLSVTVDPGCLTIATANRAGRADGRAGPGSRLGLLGIAERVDVLGGTLRHGTERGRFELVATLPLAADPVVVS